ncbi:hypothetical protein BCV69DRAFT_283583 [Microstroma glucosiphilum]|uniref:GAR domain-containing protein n=1 Tax=Pseudomicrostroma glucosiphilum TaxID=1684307 RepID=A0A316U455_9BASI|nr:hypothetical protein BCV69DRAFT_283583 [Pseudomicrostroma glucosiphilum]PWN20052.1 hypothetical protein BCV69DRAFT_283583 [Pseudomicrostroma glucosiphilum]
MAASVLTDQETAELSRFSQGRAHIQSHLDLLGSRPAVDPFAHFVPVWNTSSEAHLLSVWSDLDARLDEVKQWIAERDQIEDEASEFDSEDMEKLRKMAKAASDGAQLSASDTDIVEVALETIVSLEKLRSLLELRALSLSLYFSRLIWETQRRDCWTTYAVLSEEMNEIVVSKSKWPVAGPPHGCDSPKDHVWPTSTQATANSKTFDRNIVSEVSQLCGRIQQFAEVQVSSAGVCLDAVIEQLQVPEEFIDEQDRIDALADEMMSQSHFLGNVLQQWQKADEVREKIRSIESRAKILILHVEHAKAEIPSAASAHSYAQSLSELSRLLEDVCGPAARDYLEATETSSRRLRLLRHHMPPAPRHIRWPAQEDLNSSMVDALNQELVAAAKQARRAKSAIEAYQEATKAASQVEEARSRLLRAVRACSGLDTECHSEWPAKSTSSSRSEEAAQIISKTVALPDTSPIPSLSHAVARLQIRLITVEGEAASAQADLTDSLLKCRSLGFASDAQQRQANEASAAWAAQNVSTKTSLAETVSLVQALELIERIQRDLSNGETDLRLDVMHWAKVAESSRFSLSKSSRTLLTPDPDPGPGNPPFAASEAALASLAAFEGHTLGSLVPETIDVLRQRCEHLSAQSLQLRQLAKWAAAVTHQAECAALVQDHFDRLCQDAEHVQSRCLLLLSDTLESTDEIDKVQYEVQELQASIAHFTASQIRDIALVGPAPDLSSLSVEGKPILLSSSDSDVQNASNTWCLTLAQKQQEIEHALQGLRKAVVDEQSRDQVGQEASVRNREEGQIDHTVAILPPAMNNAEVSSPSPAQSIVDNRGHDDGQYAERPNGPSTDPSTSASLTFPSPCLPTTPRRSAKQHLVADAKEPEQERPHSQAQSRSYMAFFAAVRDCEQELGRRERSFTKVLESKASRRLPLRAFISELGNRRNDAEEKLSIRLEVVKSALELLQDTVALGESSSTVAQAQQDAARIASAVQELLARLDGVILAEGGDSPIHSGQPLYVASELSRSKSSVSSLSADLEGRFRISAGSADVVRSRSAPSLPHPADIGSLPNSPAPGEVPAAGPKIADLAAKLSGGEVEIQTIVDGLAQMKAFLDLPTNEESRRVQDEWVQLRGEVEAILQQHSAEAAGANLQALSRQREEQVNRFKLLTIFAEKAAESEAALASFLDLLDQAGNESFDDDLRALSPPNAHSMKEEDSASKTPCYTPQSARNGEDSELALNLSYAQRTRAALAALEPILEQAKQAAAPVSQDIRVKERLAQINRSYVDMAEMASDVLNPGLQRSSSVSSLASTASRGSSSASLPPSPVMSMSSRFGFSTTSTVSAAAAPASKAVSAAARPSVSPAPSVSSIPRARKISSTSSTNQEPTATALRALRRKSGAHKTTPLEHQEAAVTQMPRRRSSASPGPATPRAPVAARTCLTSITGSPATPTASQPRAALGSDPFGTPTPSRLRAPSTFARPSSMGTSTPRTPSVKPSTSAARKRPASVATPKLTDRPNSYRANPKSKLDVAVAQTINRLSVPVKIEAVKPSGNATYEDHSGKYWVGHPDPRLCFCRILRSRTIMVRVGGGWQELTRYLMQHHGLSTANVELGLAQTSPASAKTSPSGTRTSAKKTNAIPWLSSSMSMEQGADRASSPAAGGDVPRRLLSQRGDISSPIFLPSQWSPTLSRKAYTNEGAGETPTRSERKRLGSSSSSSAAVEAIEAAAGLGLGVGLRADNRSRHVRKSFSTSSPAPRPREREQKSFQVQMKAPIRLPSHGGAENVDPDDSLGSVRSVYFR